MSLPEAAGTSAAGEFRLAAGPGAALAATGPLTFVTARRAWQLGLAVLAGAAGTREIDCHGITHSDSAGLAVLLEWLSAARRSGRSLRYTQLPAGLAALARISDVQELLERGV